MRTGSSLLVAAALLVLLVTPGGCRHPHEGWQPPFEVSSTRLLQQEADVALRLVGAARADLAGSNGPADERLSGAVRALERLTVYYLPLLEAKERTYNAHRFLFYGERGRADTELTIVREILDGTVEAGGEPLLELFVPALDLVGEAQAAVRGAPEKAPAILKELAVKLNLMLLKGDLALPDDWPPRTAHG